MPSWKGDGDDNEDVCEDENHGVYDMTMRMRMTVPTMQVKPGVDLHRARPPAPRYQHVLPRLHLHRGRHHHHHPTTMYQGILIVDDQGCDEAASNGRTW